MPFTPSPLRYPGGKTQLYPLVRALIVANGLTEGTYIEPFAGGGGLALKLLLKGDVHNIAMNDFDDAIFAFWKTLLDHTEILCRLIRDTPVTVDEWMRQKQIYNNKSDYSLTQLGFAAFFLNRTNMSGVIKGGIIGGKSQTGSHKIDARYNKPGLIKRIEQIIQFRNNIAISNLDASQFIDSVIHTSRTKIFVNFDPPYVKKGAALYQNFFNEEDHIALAHRILQCTCPWITTYDICKLTQELYRDCRAAEININYSSGRSKSAKEYIFFSNGMRIPKETKLSLQASGHCHQTPTTLFAVV